MALELDGRHVVVTGGTGELGSAVCAELLSRGASVHVPVRQAFVPESFALSRNERMSLRTSLDLTDEAAVAAFYRELPALWASIHVAGGFAMSPIAETSLDAFDAMMKLNLATCFLACREAIASFRRGGRGGRIVNVASRAAIDPPGGMAAYACSKAAVCALTRALAEETRAEHILINAILPSIIDTPTNRKSMPDGDFENWPKPAELAQTVAFLASPANRLTTGALVPAYGRA